MGGQPGDSRCMGSWNGNYTTVCSSKTCRIVFKVPNRSTDVHEPSYLPFLFSDKGTVTLDDNTSAHTQARAPGRRVFNKKGEDVSEMVRNYFMSVLPILIKLMSPSRRPPQVHRHKRPLFLLPLLLLGHPQAVKLTHGRYRYRSLANQVN